MAFDVRLGSSLLFDYFPLPVSLLRFALFIPLHFFPLPLFPLGFSTLLSSSYVSTRGLAASSLCTIR